MMPEGPEVRTLVDQLQPGVGLRLCDLQVSAFISENDIYKINVQYLEWITTILICKL